MRTIINSIKAIKYHYNQNTKVLEEVIPVAVHYKFDGVYFIPTSLYVEHNGETIEFNHTDRFYASTNNYECNFGAKIATFDPTDLTRTIFGKKLKANDKGELVYYINDGGECKEMPLLGTTISYLFDSNKWTHSIKGKFYASRDEYYDWEDYKVIEQDGKETIHEAHLKPYLMHDDAKAICEQIESLCRKLHDVGYTIYFNDDDRELEVVSNQFKLTDEYPYSEEHIANDIVRKVRWQLHTYDGTKYCDNYYVKAEEK